MTVEEYISRMREKTMPYMNRLMQRRLTDAEHQQMAAAWAAFSHPERIAVMRGVLELPIADAQADAMIARLSEYVQLGGHTRHCTVRQLHGDGECDCGPDAMTVGLGQDVRGCKSAG